MVEGHPVPASSGWLAAAWKPLLLHPHQIQLGHGATQGRISSPKPGPWGSHCKDPHLVANTTSRWNRWAGTCSSSPKRHCMQTTLSFTAYIWSILCHITPDQAATAFTLFQNITGIHFTLCLLKYTWVSCFILCTEQPQTHKTPSASWRSKDSTSLKELHPTSPFFYRRFTLQCQKRLLIKNLWTQGVKGGGGIAGSGQLVGYGFN